MGMDTMSEVNIWHSLRLNAELAAIAWLILGYLIVVILIFQSWTAALEKGNSVDKSLFTIRATSCAAKKLKKIIKEKSSLSTLLFFLYGQVLTL